MTESNSRENTGTSNLADVTDVNQEISQAQSGSIAKQRSEREGIRFMINYASKYAGKRGCYLTFLGHRNSR